MNHRVPARRWRRRALRSTTRVSGISKLVGWRIQITRGNRPFITGVLRAGSEEDRAAAERFRNDRRYIFYSGSSITTGRRADSVGRGVRV